MEEKIRKILAGILEIETGEIGDDFGPDSCQNWDSLANLRVITALEHAFHIKFVWTEISAMTSFTAISDVIGRRLENER
jgi:acyl carrier protein